MRLRLTYLRAGLVLSLATLATFILTFTASGTPQHVAEARFDGWGYVVVADPDGFARAHVEFDRATAAQLHHYVAVNRALAHQVANSGQKDLSVTVSFRKPLSIDEFRDWARKVPLRVSGYQLRIVAADGRRWTLGGAPQGTELVSTPDVQRHLSNLAAKGATDVRGIIVAEGVVDAAAYDQLANEPSVFVADVTRSAAKAHIAKNVRGIDQARLAVLVAPAFSWMEDLGLDNFQKD